MKREESVLVHLVGVLDSIETDLMMPLRVHERENRGGFLSISRQAFCYVDYLGALAFGSNSSKNAVRFMEEYLTQASSAYEGKCNLMYGMWRHGTVHEYDPKVFASASKGFRLCWGANNTSLTINRKWHLKCLCRASKPGSYHWFVNLFQLVEDLRESIILFVRDLEDDPSRLKGVQGHYRKMSHDVDLDKTHGLLTEAEAVVAGAAGVIDDSGQVTEEFADTADLEAFKNDRWGL